MRGSCPGFINTLALKTSDLTCAVQPNPHGGRPGAHKQACTQPMPAHQRRAAPAPRQRESRGGHQGPLGAQPRAASAGLRSEGPLGSTTVRMVQNFCHDDRLPLLPSSGDENYASEGMPGAGVSKWQKRSRAYRRAKARSWRSSAAMAGFGSDPTRGGYRRVRFLLPLTKQLRIATQSADCRLSGTAFTG